MPPDIWDREIAVLAAHRARPLDPLRIYYVVLLPEEPLEETSRFQGFQLGWQHIDWARGALTCRDRVDWGFRTGLMHTKMNPISRLLVIPAR